LHRRCVRALTSLSRRLIQKYFDEISLDTGKICFGVDDTLRGLELGAVETLIVWDALDVTRHVLRDSSGKDVVIHTQAPPPTASNATAAAAQDAKAAAAATGTSAGIAMLSEVDRAKFMDASTGMEMEQSQEPQPLLEWIAENYQSFGASLEFVTSEF
jgi:peptide chain release factor subunit 1